MNALAIAVQCVAFFHLQLGAPTAHGSQPVTPSSGVAGASATVPLDGTDPWLAFERYVRGLFPCATVALADSLFTANFVSDSSWVGCGDCVTLVAAKLERLTGLRPRADRGYFGTVYHKKADAAADVRDWSAALRCTGTTPDQSAQ